MHKREHLPQEYDNWFDYKYDSILKENSEFIDIGKYIVSDCDGIITDSRSVYSKNGKQFKTYGAYDKEMMFFMIRLGWKFIFVSDDKEGIEITFSRLNHLNSKNNIEYYNYNVEERFQLVKKLMERGNVVLFIGDSISDIKILNVSTYSATTSNSPYEVKKYCDIISNNIGSFGGFSEILYEINDFLLKRYKNI